MRNKDIKILIIILIITIIVVGYIIVNKRDTQNDKINVNNNNNTNLENINFDPKWDKLSKKEFEEIISERKDIYFEKEFGLDLSEEVDLTGDGINEAIVEGNGGNNGVSFILIKNNNNQIDVANQKNKDGSISTVSLISIGRVMVSEGYEIVPSEKGFYTISLEIDESKDNSISSNFKCREDAVAFYLWNPKTKLFEWDKPLTSKYTTQICK